MTHNAGPVADDDDDDEPESPLDGANCSVHGDHPAFRVCPSCRRNVCLSCWHPAIVRCHACLVRDAEQMPPIPWEDPRRNVVSRFFATILSAFSPESSGASLARESSRTGLLFALLSFVPLALASGIIPYTRTLLFAPGLGIEVLHGATREQIQVDVAVAAAMGLGVSLALVLAIALPYVSLSRAYADRGMPSAPVRIVMYRAWLLPLFLTFWHGLFWIAPAPTSAISALALQLPAVLAVLLLLASLRSTARMGSGAGPLATTAIVIVPLVLMMMVLMMLQPLVPSAEDLGLPAPVPTLGAPPLPSSTPSAPAAPATPIDSGVI